MYIYIYVYVYVYMYMYIGIYGASRRRGGPRSHPCPGAPRLGRTPKQNELPKQVSSRNRVRGGSDTGGLAKRKRSKRSGVGLMRIDRSLQLVPVHRRLSVGLTEAAMRCVY